MVEREPARGNVAKHGTIGLTQSERQLLQDWWDAGESCPRLESTVIPLLTRSAAARRYLEELESLDQGLRSLWGEAPAVCDEHVRAVQQASGVVGSYSWTGWLQVLLPAAGVAAGLLICIGLWWMNSGDAGLDEGMTVAEAEEGTTLAMVREESDSDPTSPASAGVPVRNWAESEPERQSPAEPKESLMFRRSQPRTAQRSRSESGEVVGQSEWLFGDEILMGRGLEAGVTTGEAIGLGGQVQAESGPEAFFSLGPDSIERLDQNRDGAFYLGNSVHGILDQDNRFDEYGYVELYPTMFVRYRDRAQREQVEGWLEAGLRRESREGESRIGGSGGTGALALSVLETEPPVSIRQAGEGLYEIRGTTAGILEVRRALESLGVGLEVTATGAGNEDLFFTESRLQAIADMKEAEIEAPNEEAIEEKGTPAPDASPSAEERVYWLRLMPLAEDDEP